MTSSPSLTLEPDFKPTLYDINKSFDVIKVDGYDGIQKEYVGRMCVFTNFIMGRKPIILVGPRASGKTNLMFIVGTYAPNYVKVGSASEKADIRDNTINKATHVVIPEINKISHSFQETLKDWGEGVESTYKTLNEWKRTLKLKLEPKPFISSIADENDAVIGEELMSRLTTIHMDSSIIQNRNVITDKLDRAKNPFKKREVTPEYVNKCIKYVHALPSIYDFKFIYTVGTSIIDAIPSRFTDSRRDIEKYLYNTYGIALFHYYDRIRINKNGKQFILITPQDAWYNHRIFGDTLIRSALKCGPQELLIVNILRQRMIKNPDRKDMNIQQIYESVLLNGVTPTTHSVNKMCDNLYKNGIIVKNIDRRPYTFEASDFFKDFDASLDWNKIVETCKENIKEVVPSVADEYIKRFCGDKIIVKDPFTGEELDILSNNVCENSVKIRKEGDNLTTFIKEEKRQGDTIENVNVEEIEEVSEEGTEQDKINKLVNKCKSFFGSKGDNEGKVDIDTFQDEFSGLDIDLLLRKGEIVEMPRGYYTILN